MVMEQQYVDVEKIVTKKLGDINKENELRSIKSRQLDAEEEILRIKKESQEENQILKNELKQLKYFVENAEPCPSCHKLILSDSRECTNCGTEFEHTHKSHVEK